MITKEEILKNWGANYLDYFVEILNKEYPLEEAIEDIKSFRQQDHLCPRCQSKLVWINEMPDGVWACSSDKCTYVADKNLVEVVIKEKI